jgi:hypothetical protein
LPRLPHWVGRRPGRVALSLNCQCYDGQSGKPLQDKHRTYETEPWPDLAYMPRWALAPDRFRVLAGLTCCLLAKPLGFGAGDIEAGRYRADDQGWALSCETARKTQIFVPNWDSAGESFVEMAVASTQ